MDKAIDYLIIGNGIAGVSAAEEIRKHDGRGHIVIVSKESYLTYNRTKLSHFICRDFTNKEMFIHDEDWYKDKKLDFILNKEVIQIDANENKVMLNDQTELNYKKLLIAVGSKPRFLPISGIEKDNVFTLRSYDDLKKILGNFSKSNRVCVIGGGLLGIEAALSIRKLGKEVDLIHHSQWLLSRQLDRELGNKVREIIEKQGIRIHLEEIAEGIFGDSSMTYVQTKAGKSIETDAVLFTVGVKPELKITEGTGILCDKGIIVGKNLRTNIDNIYAAGDVVEINKNVLCLWSIAKEQGKVAGANMAGKEIEYNLPQSATLLSIENYPVFSVGDVKVFDTCADYSEEDKCCRLYITDNKLTGAVLMGDISKLPKVKKAVNNKKHINKSTDFNVVEILKEL